MTSNKKNQAALDEVRQRIDALDEQIQALISERASLAFEVGASKGDLPHPMSAGYAGRGICPMRSITIARNAKPRSCGPCWSVTKAR